MMESEKKLDDEKERFKSETLNGRYKVPWKHFHLPNFKEKVGFVVKYAMNEKPSGAELDAKLPIANLDGTKLSQNIDDGIQVTWLGHASLIIKMHSLTILTDPVFSARCSPSSYSGPKRYRAVPTIKGPVMNAYEAVENLGLEKVDFVLISHDHYDHLDVESLRALAKKYSRIHWIVPAGVDDWLRTTLKNELREFNIPAYRHEFQWWQKKQIKNAEFQFVPAKHWSGRGIFDHFKTLWGAWCVTTKPVIQKNPESTKELKFFFAGDTGYCNEVFKIVGKEHGGFDLAAIPIGAYLPRHLLSPQHVDPNEAVEIHKDINSRQSVGIHWGTFALGSEPYLKPPEDLNAAMDNAGLERKNFIAMQHGEIIHFYDPTLPQGVRYERELKEGTDVDLYLDVSSDCGKVQQATITQQPAAGLAQQPAAGFTQQPAAGFEDATLMGKDDDNADADSFHSTTSEFTILSIGALTEPETVKANESDNDVERKEGNDKKEERQESHALTNASQTIESGTRPTDAQSELNTSSLETTEPVETSISSASNDNSSKLEHSLLESTEPRLSLFDEVHRDQSNVYEQFSAKSSEIKDVIEPTVTPETEDDVAQRINHDINAESKSHSVKEPSKVEAQGGEIGNKSLAPESFEVLDAIATTNEESTPNGAKNEKKEGVFPHEPELLLSETDTKPVVEKDTVAEQEGKTSSSLPQESFDMVNNSTLEISSNRETIPEENGRETDTGRSAGPEFSLDLRETNINPVTETSGLEEQMEKESFDMLSNKAPSLTAGTDEASNANQYEKETDQPLSASNGHEFSLELSTTDTHHSASSESSQVADQKEKGGAESSQVTDQREKGGAESSQATDQREKGGSESSQVTDQREKGGSESSQATDQREKGGSESSQATDQRDKGGSESSQASDQREKGGAGDVPGSNEKLDSSVPTAAANEGESMSFLILDEEK